MSEIALQAYESEINQLIEDARYLEALAHTRHILSQHPHYVGAYYLLGKTMLEADQSELAIDLFRRALNGDPEHLLARIGLTLAYQRVNNLDAAIWNLERAVELAPGNPDLADELCQLYGRRDGVEPSYVPLSRTGLARLYLRGNRPERAVEELRTLVTEEPQRVDLQLALAEAYWRDDQIVQAAETCQIILESLRYCLKANLLLGTLWTNSGQEEGQIYLDRAHEVDLENTLANEMFGSSSPLKPQEVKLDRLVYTPDVIADDTEARWFKELEAASVTVGISEAMPEMTESEMQLVDITAGLEAQIAIPDWLRELGDEEEGGGLSWMADLGVTAPTEEETAEATPPDWLQTEETEAVAAEQDIPDWLSALKGEEAPTEESSLGLADEAIATEEATPDWLSDLESAVPAAESMPDWLNELEPGTPENVAESESPADDELPDWIETLPPAGPAEVTGKTPPPTGEMPDWLRELKPQEAEAAEEPEELSDWLRQRQAEATTVEEAGAEAAPSGESGEQQAAAETEAAATEAIDEGTIPDWLAAFQPAPPEAADMPGAGQVTEEVTAEEEEDHPAIETGEEVGEEATTEALPDWLSELHPAEVEAAAEPAEEEMLAWLGDIQPEAETSVLKQEEKHPEQPGTGETRAKAEIAAPAEEESLNWEALAEELEKGGAEEPAPEVAPTAEGDLLSGDDALAWLESLTAGKEEELRAQAEVEAQARVNEILGRQPEAPPPPELIASEEPASASEPEISKSEIIAGLEQIAGPTSQPAVEQPETAPAPEFAEGDLVAMRSYVQSHEADHAARLALARALWKAGEIEAALENYALLVQADAEMPDVMADLRQATEERPEDAMVLQALGDAYMAQGLVDQALEIYNRAMNLL